MSPLLSSTFNDKGFLLVENLFSPQEADIVLAEMHSVIEEDCPERILEKNGRVRSFFAPDARSRIFYEVIHSKRLIDIASYLLEARVYVHQTKLNTKFAMLGDWWEWHQDFIFWKKDDGMPDSKVLTAMVFLSDINEFNGPVLLIPGSHREGMIDEQENKQILKEEEGWFNKYKQSTSYMSALTADLKYTLKQSTIARSARENGIFSAKGPAGSVLFFHGNIFHASNSNLSPWDRHAFLITYNSIHNALSPVPNPRPEFLACRKFAAIQPVVSEIFK